MKAASVFLGELAANRAAKTILPVFDGCDIHVQVKYTFKKVSGLLHGRVSPLIPSAAVRKPAR